MHNHPFLRGIHAGEHLFESDLVAEGGVVPLRGQGLWLFLA